MTEKRDSDQNILISFGEGAYGPTIRIETRSPETVIRVRNLLLELASGRVREIKLHEIDSLKIKSIKEFSLKSVSEGREHRKTLKLVQTTSEGPVFHWGRSSEGWRECAELLDGILQHQRPGHQYLTDEAVDDALVIVTFMES
jgi:hypothetical protein